MKKTINFLRANILFIIVLILIIFLCNYQLPYYVNMPGGTININDRIDCNNCNSINGNLNMLYVSEYNATIPLYLLSYLIPNWDLEEISNQQINNEDTEAIYQRGRVMLDNSINNAIYVAFTTANKSITINSKKNIVIATTLDNGLQIGDEILKVNNKEINDVEEIKQIIKTTKKNEYLSLNIIRNNKEMTTKSQVKEVKNSKIIGVVMVTDYDYKTNPKINLKFKTSESGSSGGLMMALSIYAKISDKDIVSGRNIAGTGTIDRNGNVGAIDGIKYKIMGAHKNNIDIVLVPSDNYKEAVEINKKNNYNMKIVKIDTFKSAIEYLEKTS